MKDIKGYEGLYAVTSCGRVWSYRRQKFLKLHERRDGYLMLHLHKDGKMYTYLVHRLVAEAYIPNPDNLPQVNHKDEFKTHNWINNLEWCDTKYNINYGTGMKRRAEKRSTKIKCVETGEVFCSMNDCARKMALNQGSISSVLSGKCKQTGGFTFDFV